MPVSFVDQVGIGMACYQPDLAFLSEQLRSIAEQSFERWICVLSWDSPIGDLREDSRFARFFADPRFHWVENAQVLGAKKNFEQAIMLAVRQGVDAIACADQDDVWYPEKLSVEALNRAGRLSLVHSDLHELRDGQVSKSSVWRTERRGVHQSHTGALLVRNIVAGCAMLFDAELARLYPVIPEGFEFHDHWYAVVASRYGGVHPIRRPLLAYRQHSRNTLGVTPFKGVFSPAADGKGRSIDACVERWKKTQERTASALAELVTFSPLQRWAYLNGLEPGLGLFWVGLRAGLAGDPALLRAAWARSIGKAIRWWSPRRNEVSWGKLALKTPKELRGLINRAGKKVVFAWDSWNSRVRHASPPLTGRKEGGVKPGSRRALCIFAHFSGKNEIAPYVIHYLAELHRLGFEIVFSSTSRDLSQEFEKIAPFCSLMLTRENRGLDFGSWKTALDQVISGGGAESLQAYDELLFANDSVFGPLTDLARVLDVFRSRREEYLGITDSFQKTYHVQSYFLLLKRPAFVSPTFLRFWSEFLFLGSKTHIIEKYEIGFTRLAFRMGLRAASLVSYRDVAKSPSMSRWLEKYPGMALNSTHHFWRETVLDFGSPFFKKELLLKNPEATDIGDWASVCSRAGNYPCQMIARELKGG
jgi:hypothetical protein